MTEILCCVRTSLLRRKYHTSMAPIRRIATPPMTPPTIGAMGVTLKARTAADPEGPLDGPRSTVVEVTEAVAGLGVIADDGDTQGRSM